MLPVDIEQSGPTATLQAVSVFLFSTNAVITPVAIQTFQVIEKLLLLPILPGLQARRACIARTITSASGCKHFGGRPS